jgi:hypothetical protein
MRFRMVMLAMVASGLACAKDPSPSRAASSGMPATSSAPAPGANTPAATPPQGTSTLDEDRSGEKVEKHALSPSPGSSGNAPPGNAPPGSATQPDEGNGEPMDDVDDGVSATDKSGVDNAAEEDDSDGTDIKVEE